jgi:hypothetical protein
MSENRLGENYNRYSKTKYEPTNNDSFIRNDFATNFSISENSQRSISQENNIEYEKKMHYLSISSKDRDTTAFPNVNRYVINFQKEYKNLHSIELVQAIIPSKNNVISEPYLLLHIDEIDNVIDSNDTNISNSFAFLQIAQPDTNNGFIQMDSRIQEYTVKYYDTPKASLSRMSITIKDDSGNPFDFGEQQMSLDKQDQNTFIFKITTLEKKRKQLNFRSVY